MKVAFRTLFYRGALALCLALPLACGGSTPPPENPGDTPPPLDDDGPAVVAASSPKVKEGMEAIQAGDFAHAKEILTQAEAEAPKDPPGSVLSGRRLGEHRATRRALRRNTRRRSVSIRSSRTRARTCRP